MRAAGWAIAALMVAMPGVACADDGAPITVAPPAITPAGLFRLKPIAAPVDPKLRVNDPASMLRSGYGGALVDVFPFEGGKFHLSGGGRLFGRAGRPRGAGDPESMRYLPAQRGGALRVGRKFSPTMLVGYGRTVERGLAIGVDAGVTMGRMGATPDRFARLNRRRLDSIDGRGHRPGLNQLARVTALYRF